MPRKVWSELTREGRRRRRWKINGARRRIAAKAHLLQILSYSPLVASCKCGWQFSADPAGRTPMQLRALATAAWRLHVPAQRRVPAFWAFAGVSPYSGKAQG